MATYNDPDYTFGDPFILFEGEVHCYKTLSRAMAMCERETTRTTRKGIVQRPTESTPHPVGEIRLYAISRCRSRPASGIPPISVHPA